MFKRAKCSIESELQFHLSILKLDKFIVERDNLLEDIETLKKDLLDKKACFNLETKVYLRLYRSYNKFLATIPPSPPHLSSIPDFSPFKTALKTMKNIQQNYDEFEKECNVRNEIMDKFRRDFMKKIIEIDLARKALDDAKSRLSEIRQIINILTVSF